jgi:hypothetical protein
VNAYVSKDCAQLVAIPGPSLRDHPHRAANGQSIEALLDEVPGNGKVCVIGRVAQDFCESGFIEIKKAFTYRADRTFNAIKSDVALRAVDGGLIMIEKENCFGPGELRGKNAEQAVSAPKVQDLVTLFHADLRKQREGAFVQLAWREQGWGGLESQLDPPDSLPDKAPSFLSVDNITLEGGPCIRAMTIRSFVGTERE